MRRSIWRGVRAGEVVDGLIAGVAVALGAGAVHLEPGLLAGIGDGEVERGDGSCTGLQSVRRSWNEGTPVG